MIDIVLLIVDQAAIVISESELRRQLDGAVEIGKRACAVAFGAPCLAAIVVGGGEIGVDADRRIVVGEGTVGLATFELGDAAIV